MSSAQAQVWRGGYEFELSTLALPDLAAGEVLVQITAATVCGSDRHTVTGRRSSPAPSVLGHEGAGVVVRSERPGIEPGQRVVFAVTDTCGECARCTAGLSAKCERVRKLGHELFRGSWLLNGTYATHLHVPAGQEVVPIPDHVPDEVASVAGCAVATVMAALEKAGDLRGRSVLVNGVGMLGLIAVVAARARGAESLIGVDPSPYSRELAVSVLAVEESMPEVSVDVALEFSGVPAGVSACLDSLDIGGTAVLAGSVAPAPPVALDPEQVVRGWHTIAGVHNYEPRHLRDAVDFLSAHHQEFPWEKILGRRYPLTDLAAAFTEKPRGLREVIVM